jgi:hypothetical protein
MFDESVYLLLLIRHKCLARPEFNRPQMKNPVFWGLLVVFALNKFWNF